MAKQHPPTRTDADIEQVINDDSDHAQTANHQNLREQALAFDLLGGL